ncbi:hypothetical protein HALLA_13530 [Halostagnicola larsenii XH-48]|uniref:Uncharacterized protein n=1 Tax=Halostagnicola larsenii XH-48 TaxID=797299 RepID=W0JQT9_9EURY|nr:hypothetical protein [Halostagnicola larsenii]AHF99651.1 hypothetical protein HALLA_13530 [Halostagnicola larsenii XH-48]
MPEADLQHSESGADEGRPPVQCDACRSAFESDSRRAVSFLLLDHLTIPVVSCEDHLEQFASVCGLTTEDTAETLDHRPAGGVRCPGCRLAPHNSAQPVIPVRKGAVLVVACPEHQSKVFQRFRTGLQTRHHLSSNVGATTNSLR